MPSPEMLLKPGASLHPALLLCVQAAIDPYAPTTVAAEEREEVLHIVTFRGGKLTPLLRQAQPVRVWAWGQIALVGYSYSLDRVASRLKVKDL